MRPQPSARVASSASGSKTQRAPRQRDPNRASLGFGSRAAPPPQQPYVRIAPLPAHQPPLLDEPDAAPAPQVWGVANPDVPMLAQTPTNHQPLPTPPPREFGQQEWAQHLRDTRPWEPAPAPPSPLEARQDLPTPPKDGDADYIGHERHTSLRPEQMVGTKRGYQPVYASPDSFEQEREHSAKRRGGARPRDPTRPTTSAVDNLSVSECRRILADMRHEWSNHSVEQPFDMHKLVTRSMRMDEFATKYIAGQQRKRHAKVGAGGGNGNGE